MLALLLASPSWAQGLPFPDLQVDDGDRVPIRDARPLPDLFLRNGPSLEGTWQLRGEHPRAGAYRGEVTFVRQEDGRYLYERRLSSGELERGQAEAVRGMVFLRGEPRESMGLSSLGSDFLTTTRQQLSAFQVARSGQALEGKTWEAGSRYQSNETLLRAGPDAANNRLELLIDGPEAFPAIYEAVDNAQSSICLQTFSWFDDAAGERMADKLIAKHREGIEVRCLVEAFPQMWGWDIGKKLEAGGVEVIVHHGLASGIMASLKRTFKRTIGRLFGMSTKGEEQRGFLNHDHRKLIVVDGRVAFTGGMNIGDKYEQGTTWHDIHSRVEGSAVPKLEELFYDRWNAAGGKASPPPAVPGDPWPGELVVIVDENLPGVRYEVTERYMEQIAASDVEIMIENPYLLYDPVVDALQAKAKAGVRTVVLIPSNDLNDEALARDAFYWTQNDIVRAGVELYKFRDRMSHGKVAVFDRKSMTVGTTNLDMMAMIRNAEVNLFVPDPGFAAHTVQRVFDADLPRSDRIEVTKLTFWEKVKGFVMHSIRRFL